MYSSYAKLRIKDSNAMAIATVDSQGIRVINCTIKGCENDELIFFTNYGSAKAKALSNPMVSALFFWREQERQVRFYEGSKNY